MTSPSIAPERETPTPTGFAWLALFLGVWLFAGLTLVVYALNEGLTEDVGFSVYHIPFYLCLAALAVMSLLLVVRARRRGRGWADAYPAGYGTLGAGFVVILAALVLDVGWREGVGVSSAGIETGLAPSRIIAGVGMLLVLVTPLRAALRAGPAVPRWPAVFAAAFLVGLMQIGGFHPAQNPRLEHVSVDPSAELWVMDADGSHQTRLTRAADGWQDWEGTLSPDGKRMAFTHLQQGGHPPVDIPDVADVWVANADGTDARPLVALDGWQWKPHWSPDGTWIVYTDEAEGGSWAEGGPAGPDIAGGLLGGGFVLGQPVPQRRLAQIWRVRADGTGAPERLTDSAGDDRAATYSPDGTKLAFDSTRDGNTEIYIMDADGSNQRLLFSDPGEDWGATWSPDGRRIAFNAGPTDADIYVVGVDGGGLAHVTDERGSNDFCPSWSPDGTRIVFARYPDVQRGMTNEIWSTAIDGSDLHNLSQTPRAWEVLPSGGGAWTADGRIVYQRGAAPVASADPLVRNDLGAASMLLVAIIMSLAAVLVRIGPPFGAFALVLGISTALLAIQEEQWRFVPAAVVGGLVVDVLVRYAATKRKAQVAGAGLAATVVLGAGATVVLTTGLGWTPNLLLGVACGAAAMGWVVGGLVGNPPLDADGFKRAGEPA